MGSPKKENLNRETLAVQGASKYPRHGRRRACAGSQVPAAYTSHVTHAMVRFLCGIRSPLIFLMVIYCTRSRFWSPQNKILVVVLHIMSQLCTCTYRVHIDSNNQPVVPRDLRGKHDQSDNRQTYKYWTCNTLL